MKAVVYTQYGPPEVLKLVDIQKPTPGSNEVLIKVVATTVTAGDWRMRKADPVLARIFNGLIKPTRVNILGFEIAGDVVAVGKDVTRFKVGDAVFASNGTEFGGYAEYKVLPEEAIIAHKPANVSYEEAAAVPIGGITAVRLLNSAGVQVGDKVLVYGASGSVGTYAVQVARYYGAEVTGVASTRNLTMVKELGADHVVDYTQQDISELDETYDVVIDAVGKLNRARIRRILKPGGKFVTARTESSKEHIDHLLLLADLLEQGQITPVIDRRYRLEEVVEAHHYVQGFRKTGNVIVKVAA